MIAETLVSMATSTSSLPLPSFHTHSPLQKLNRHSYLTKLFFTKKSGLSNCKSFSVGDPSSSSSSSPPPTPFSASSSSSIEMNNSDPMVPPYNVLITGSSKGIGYALAKEFLNSGDNVIICSRSEERVKSAIESLKEETGKQHVWGTKCDVRDGNDVKNLVAFAQEQLKYIDIWNVADK